jgi:membrane-bound lytic murein transglycosylase D
VRKWVTYFTGPGRSHFQYWLDRKEAVDSLVTGTLREAGLPDELIFLAMIESGLSCRARSSVGAVGPWQFMAGPAKQFDLRKDWWVDERRDFEMSTQAAAAYLQRLYAEFQDWALVLAAYNAGEHRIARSIRLAGHTNYWRLHLPNQTKNFVPKFIAAARLGSDPEAAGFQVNQQPKLAYDVVPVDDATDLDLIARCAAADKAVVRQLNPALLRGASPPDTPDYPVRVPAGTGVACRRALRKIPLDERLTWRRHRVQRGETLSQIAEDYGTTVPDIAQLNSLSRVNLIRPGDQLLIPMPSRLVAKARERALEKGHYVPPDGYRRVTYKVKPGDTLSGIARKLGVSLSHLRKVNGLYKSSLIHPGQRLYAYRPEATAKGG